MKQPQAAPSPRLPSRQPEATQSNQKAPASPSSPGKPRQPDRHSRHPQAAPSSPVFHQRNPRRPRPLQTAQAAQSNPRQAKATQKELRRPRQVKTSPAPRNSPKQPQFFLHFSVRFCSLFSVSFLSWAARIELRLGRIKTVSNSFSSTKLQARSELPSQSTKQRKVSQNAQKNTKNLFQSDLGASKCP